MSFANIGYAKLNLSFDREKFIHEFDTRILPHSRPMTTGKFSINATKKLNSLWKMVPDDIYDKVDCWEQLGDASTVKFIYNDRPMWQMFQLMELVTVPEDDPRVVKFATIGGSPIRNETLGRQYKVKQGFEDLEIVKWAHSMLPLESISFMHCVSIEPGGFATIHRDGKGLFSADSTAGVNKVFNSGYVVICINVSDGGVPLYWSLDHDVKTAYQATGDVYISNDYFLHGVPVCTSTRRQVRVLGKPTPELRNLIDASTKVEVGENYAFSPVLDQYKFNI